VIILAIILFRNNRHKQKANLLLQQQKKEIDKKADELAEQKDNLEQSYKNIELLGDIGRKITSSLSVETIIGTVYDNVNSLMDASVFGIGIYHDDTKRIEFPATYENGVALPAYTNSIYEENRFASLCFISGKEIIMGDLQSEYKNFLQDVLVPKQGQQPISLIYMPLKAKEKALGVITVQSFNKNAFSDYHVYMLRNIAIYAAIGLENAESYKKLNQTVDSLKKTQTQLIQSEKMASLGELTAGIAHEIQNPLNFVNNFSEVNTELIDELEQEISKGNLDEIRSLAKDIKENEQKINHHGKRADAIVKGMLQHSRSSSGQKELADINSLADEYLRLAYHGLRAKDKSFNASFRTNLDKNIDRVNIIPQDIGRVLVNLINNAFYAVSEKRRQTSNGYDPTVTVTTKKTDGKVEVSVKDNGNGIPQKILDKIFQPFFTTKPTGEGTGLGLSLSYDIVKAHGGELKVATEEGQGSEFIIQLPTN
jgi:signal transduction histidine kinase